MKPVNDHAVLVSSSWHMAALSKTCKVSVLATPGTIRSHAYPIALRNLNPNIEVHQVACPLFVPLAEEGWLDHEVTEIVAETYLSELTNTGIDTVILGCTHYPLLEGIIAKVLGSCTETRTSTQLPWLPPSENWQLSILSTQRDSLTTFLQQISHRSQIVANAFAGDQNLACSSMWTSNQRSMMVRRLDLTHSQVTTLLILL